MKHWDGQDAAESTLARLSSGERQRVRRMFAEAPKPKRGRSPQVHSMIGLTLALGMLGLLAWALAPSSPVSSDLLK